MHDKRNFLKAGGIPGLQAYVHHDHGAQNSPEWFLEMGKKGVCGLKAGTRHASEEAPQFKGRAGRG